METSTLDRFIELGLNILAAIIILVVGLWLAKWLRTLLRNSFEKRAIDPLLVGFFSNLIYAALVVFIVIAAIGKVGIQTTSFVAVVGAAGLAIGLALQGSLSNFASGVLIIIFKPFSNGHFIDIGGIMGTVVETGILFTELKTPDNRKIIVPNSRIMSGPITNVSANPTRRVDIKLGVSYSDDLDKVTEVIKDVLSNDARVLPEPEPQVVVCELGDSSVDFHVRPWVNASDYWGFFFDFHKTIKQRFDAEAISIPFPQRDVHLYSQKAQVD
jgi:small conductance mechanosensitive channel